MSRRCQGAGSRSTGWIHTVGTVDAIEWIEASAATDLHDLLDGYDHHRFDVDGRTAVLITYVRGTNPDRGVLAVLHPAASHHPVVPATVQRRLGRLAWQPSDPPRSLA